MRPADPISPPPLAVRRVASPRVSRPPTSAGNNDELLGLAGWGRARASNMQRSGYCTGPLSERRRRRGARRSGSTQSRARVRPPDTQAEGRHLRRANFPLVCVVRLLRLGAAKVEPNWRKIGQCRPTTGEHLPSFWTAFEQHSSARDRPKGRQQQQQEPLLCLSNSRPEWQTHKAHTEHKAARYQPHTSHTRLAIDQKCSR